MVRIFLLVIPFAIIFAGFAAPFLVEGAPGLVLAPILILTGSILLCLIEIKTKKSLQRDTLLNRLLNTDA